MLRGVTTQSGLLIRAYRGPNGWYVAIEDEDGFHRQPGDGGRLDESQITAALIAMRDAIDDDDHDDDDHWRPGD